MLYRNTRTGAVIDIKAELKSNEWEPLKAEPVKAAPKKASSAKKRSVKK